MRYKIYIIVIEIECLSKNSMYIVQFHKYPINDLSIYIINVQRSNSSEAYQ
jgi:hypothetical protein